MYTVDAGNGARRQTLRPAEIDLTLASIAAAAARTMHIRARSDI